MSMDDIPDMWSQHSLTNGEVRTLLNIMMNLDPENEVICDFVVIARVHENDRHSYGESHRGVILSDLEDWNVKSYLETAMRQLDD